MHGFTRDIRHAARSLARTPAFLVAGVLTLALGIGATTAIFSVVNAILLRSLPYPDANRIVRLWEVGAKGGRMNASDPDYDDLRTHSRSFASLAEVADYGVISVSGGAEPVRAHLAEVSSSFFDVMGVRPVAGRLFTPEERQVGGRPAVVVSEAFWKAHLGGAPIGAGRTLSFENELFDVVGVMPAALDYPTGAELWVPRELDPVNPHRTAHNFRLVGRLAPGVSLDRARADVHAIATQLRRQYGDATDMVDASVVPLQEEIVGHLRPALLVLLGASAFLLLIACANVVNLMMARMAARSGELALRLALGATRARLVQQFVAEAMVLALAGGVLGVGIAALGIRALLALDPGGIPRVHEVGMHWPVLLFALALSIAAAAAMGVLVAWRAGRADLRAMLAESQRTQAGAGASYRLRGALVMGQVAATLVLLVGAGLLARSFLALLSVDPGFRTRDAIVLDVSLPPANDSAALRERSAFYASLLERLRAIPGVRDAGGVNVLPLGGDGGSDGTFLVLSSATEPFHMEDFERLARDRASTGHAEYRVASRDYFRAMHIPLVAGRLFDERDDAAAPHVALISESLARSRWPGEDPIGKVIEFGNMDGDTRPFTVVGVVGDVREASLASPPRPTFYADVSQRPGSASSFDIVLTGRVETAAVADAARAAVRALRPDVPPRVRPIESVVAGSVADRRFTLLLIGTFAAAALLLAALGVYGVISYLVTQRRQEIGVRIALGASTDDVLRLVLRQGMVLAAGGIVAGTVLALALTRLVRGLLYGVSATDPVSFAAVIAGVIVVAGVASLVPAARAARIAPMSILRGG